MDNFKDNHVERLKELENRVNGEEFLRARVRSLNITKYEVVH